MFSRIAVRCCSFNLKGLKKERRFNMFNKPSDCPIIFCFQDMEQMSYKFKRRVPTLGEFDCLPALSGDAAHLRTNQTVSQNEALLLLIFHSTRSIVFDF